MFANSVKPPSVLDRMEAALYPAVIAPFNGENIEPIIIRTLSHAQIESCGKFSLIETFSDKLFKKQNVSFDEMSKYAETQHNIAKLALISPTYDEIFKIVTKHENIEEIEKQLKHIEDKFHEAKINDEYINPKDLKNMEEEFAMLEMRSRYCFPSDFLSFVVSYALGIDKSDIKLLSEEILYEAAIKAKMGHDNPADHIHGNFTDFNKEDINNRSWIIYHDKKKAK